MQRLLPFTQYQDSVVHRRGVVGALRNCCFEYGESPGQTPAAALACGTGYWHLPGRAALVLGCEGVCQRCWELGGCWVWLGWNLLSS